MRHDARVNGLVLVGYWREGRGSRWPDPWKFIDDAWDPAERDSVADYLSHGFVPWVAMGESQCRICRRRNGSAELSDGVYVWPEGLGHYVKDHSVRLPLQILEHIRERRTSPFPVNDGAWGVADFNNVDREEWKAMTRDALINTSWSRSRSPALRRFRHLHKRPLIEDQ
jgi:hypothetical protein